MTSLSVTSWDATDSKNIILRVRSTGIAMLHLKFCLRQNFTRYAYAIPVPLTQFLTQEHRKVLFFIRISSVAQVKGL